MTQSVGQRALAEALRHVGVRESPPGSNRTMFGRWFGVDGVPWCSIFVSYCFDVGAGVVLCRDWHGGEPDHVGIVVIAGPGGSIETVEGNTAVGNDSDGGQVMRRRRAHHQVAGFG